MRAMIRSLIAPSVEVVAECGSGEESIELYARHHPDVVLMDVELEGGEAGLDGISATAEICSRDPLAHIVIVTAHDDARVRTAAVRAGAKGFVLKENVLDLIELLSATI